MPGPVSDSYDPEFSTGANADDVERAIRELSGRVTSLLGPSLRNIVEVVHGGPGPTFNVELSERELRVLRFACNRAAETV